jgi:integrase
MASIERRHQTAGGKVTWRAHYRDPDGRQRSKSFERKVDAQRFLITVESAMLASAYIDPARSALTVGALIDQWLAGKINLKPSTRARYESAIEVHVRPRWGDLALSKVTFEGVQEWLVQMDDSGLSSASIRKAYGVLNGVLKRAVRAKRIAANPADGVDLPSLVERKRRYLTASEVTALAEASGRYRLAVLVLAYCGLRWSELAALRVGRIDLMRRRLNVAEAMVEVNGGRLEWGTPKSHESRSVPLPRFLVDELAAHLAGKSSDTLVFTSPAGGPLRNRNARRDWFDAAAEQGGAAGLTPHELRHTAASLAVSAGANVKAVQRMLGHASAALTLDRYADLFDDDLDAVAERLDAVGRAAGVAYPLPTAEVVDLVSVRK